MRSISPRGRSGQRDLADESGRAALLRPPLRPRLHLAALAVARAGGGAAIRQPRASARAISSPSPPSTSRPRLPLHHRVHHRSPARRLRDREPGHVSRHRSAATRQPNSDLERAAGRRIARIRPGHRELRQRGAGDQHMRDLAAVGHRAERTRRPPAHRARDRLPRNLARSLRMVPGRKQVVLLSEGFDAQSPAGLRCARLERTDELQHADRLRQSGEDRYRQDVRQHRRAESRSSGWPTPSAPPTSCSTPSTCRACACRTTLDEGSIINSNAGLFLVSRPTGGEVFQNSNDLHADFERLLRQQEVVYVLGFHSPPTMRRARSTTSA